MLTSLQNDQVKYVVGLHKRKFREETGQFLIEGWRFLEEAILHDADIAKVYVCPPKQAERWAMLAEALHVKGIPVAETNEKTIRKMSDTENPQGVVAVMNQPRRTWQDMKIETGQVLLVLDGIQDPGNCGMILRTALAAGVRHICLTEGSVDIYNPKVLRSTMGAIFSHNVLQNVLPSEIMAYCAERDIQLVTADVEGADLYQADLHLPLALVVGNEGNGLSDAFRRPEMNRITIPMSNQVESLNVAMATGIILYELVRRQR